MHTHLHLQHHLISVLMVSAFFLTVAGCGQQPSQDLLNQMNTRLEQLEQRVTQLEAKDAEFSELVNDGKASSIKLEEAIAALTQQVEKIASRPSAPSVQKSAQPLAAPAPGRTHHTVARGETLYSIAKRYGLSVDELCRLNNLRQEQPIRAGQKLAVSPEAQ